MVAEAYGDQLLAVGGTEVETVGGGFAAELLLLKFHDLYDGLVHRVQHRFDWVFFLPSILCATVGKIGDVQGGGVLGVSATQDIAVGVETEQVCHVAADIEEVGDGAVVHEDVAAEDERVTVGLVHNAATGCSDVGKKAMGFGIAAKVAEVEIADWWGLGLVQGWSCTFHILDVIVSSVGVPCYPKAVHVEKTITHLEESVFGVVELVLFSMW